MPKIHVREIQTNRVVHTVTTKYPLGSSNYERVADGLFGRIDHDRFFVDEQIGVCALCSDPCFSGDSRRGVFSDEFAHIACIEKRKAERS